jgi:hypothetical protein
MIEKTLSLEEEAERLMKIGGNVRGEIFHNDAAYIRYRNGEAGLSKVEEKMKELGHPINFKEIRSLEWYPEALSVLVRLTAKEVFNWRDSDIFDMGNSSPKHSFTSKVLIKYLLSLKEIAKKIPNYWKKHLDFGTLEVVKLNEEEKHLTLRVVGYKFHPIMCIYHSGYFLRIAQFVIKSGKITIEEIKCPHRGNPHHEYIIKW